MADTYECPECGMVVEVVKESGNTPSCCGRPMALRAPIEREDVAASPVTINVSDVHYTRPAVPGAIAVPLAVAAVSCATAIAVGFAAARQTKALAPHLSRPFSHR